MGGNGLLARTGAAAAHEATTPQGEATAELREDTGLSERSSAERASAQTPDTVWHSAAPSGGTSQDDAFVPRDPFSGYWVHRGRPGILEVIRGDTLCGPDGTLRKLAFVGEDRMSVPLHGQVFEAQLVDGQLLWDDGDVWVRAEGPPPPQQLQPALPQQLRTGPGPVAAVFHAHAVRAAPGAQGPPGLLPPLRRPPFNGSWVHKRNPDILETISGDRLIGPTGRVHAMTFNGANRFSIELMGRAYQAQLVGSELVWDDGDVWVRTGVSTPFDGRWVHRSNPRLVEVIEGGTLFGPDGTAKRIAALGNDRFSLVLHGDTYQARLVGDQLQWSDGDMWMRERSQGACTVM